MTRFIAEISSNHNGDPRRCRELIQQAAACGCWGVKFQLFRVERLFSPEILQTSEQHRLRRRWELPRYLLPELAAHAHREGLAFGCTPFDLDAVEVLRSQVDFLKIASYELPWLPLIQACARTGLPLMISTGMADENEIRRAVATARGNGTRQLTVFHCVSSYPLPREKSNLSALGTLRTLLDDIFPTAEIGWSDHSVRPGVIARAINTWGAKTVEFHFDLEGAGEEFSAGHCWLPAAITPVIANRAVPAGPMVDGSPELAASSLETGERPWRADPGDGLRPTLDVRRTWLEHKGPAPGTPLIYFQAGGPGLGHVVRLLALAEAVRSSGKVSCLFKIPDSAGARTLLDRHGFLHQNTPLEEAPATPALVVIDQKEPCRELVAHWHDQGIPVVVLDRPDCQAADLVIVPAWGWTGTRERQIGGSEFLLLRGDVVARRPPAIGSPGHRLVVSFGGEDPQLLTEKTAAALADFSRHVPVQFIIGPDFRKHRSQWPSPILARDGFQLIQTRDPLEAILPGAGLLVTALGVTIAEAQVLGVPVAVLCNYETDAPQARVLAEDGMAANLGFHADLSVPDLAARLNDLWQDEPRRLSLARAGWQKIDGQGARRAADLVLSLLESFLSGKDGSC